MSSNSKSISVTINGVTYTGNVERVETEPRRAVFLLAQHYGEREHYSVTDLECGNLARKLDARQTALREAAATRFPEDPRSTRIHALHCQATEKTPNYLAWKYIWRNIQQKHIDWLYQLRDCGVIDGLSVEYEPASSDEERVYQGGTVQSGHMAIVGEAGNDEMVLGGAER